MKMRTRGAAIAAALLWIAACGESNSDPQAEAPNPTAEAAGDRDPSGLLVRYDPDADRLEVRASAPHHRVPNVSQDAAKGGGNRVRMRRKVG